MNKNIRIQLFLDGKLYADLVEIAKRKNIRYKNDSQMCYKMLNDYQNAIGSLDITVYSMKDQILRHKETISQLQAVIEGMRGIKDRERKDKEIKDHNKNLKKKVKK